MCPHRSEICRGSQQCLHLVAGLLVAVSMCGCQAAPRCDERSEVSSEISTRFGAELNDGREPGDAVVPPGVTLEDGMTEDEAVQIALWNNALLQETLAQLGLSSAQLFNAGLIPDPQFTIFFPLGPKQLEFTGFQAVDALWLRPIRVRAAGLNLEQISQSMIQNGLDVIRDTRLAHANLTLAVETAEFSREAARLRAEIADLAQKRLAAGDISELEATTSRIDALQAKATAERAIHDVTLARERLRVLLGLTMYGDELNPVADAPGSLFGRSVEDLLNEALAMRPDLRASELAIESADELASLARNQFMNLDVIYDANGEGMRGFESGLGTRLTVPIFNRNRGGIAIADAQRQQAARNYVTVRDRVALEVKTSHTQVVQARENLSAIRREILPAVKTAEELARRNYQNGAAPYFLVLQTTGQYLDARLRELQLEADVRRAIAELERAVGHRVSVASDPLQEIGVPPAPATSEHREAAPSAGKSFIQTAGWRTTHLSNCTERSSVRSGAGNGKWFSTPKQNSDVVHGPID